MATLNAHLSSAPETTRNTRLWPVAALFSRLTLFALWQAAIAAVFLLGGDASPWEAAAAWWPIIAILTNLLSLGLLAWLFHRENQRLWNVYKFDRGSVKQDLLVYLGLSVVSLPIAFLPNLLLGNWLFGSAEGAAALFFRPLPLWAAWLAVLAFPITNALAELPTYFSYAMPRLGKGWGPVIVAGLFLALQHVTLCFLFDWRFIIWRLGMFIPFALFIAIVLRWRPRLLPYLLIGHALMDLQLGLMVLGVS